MDTGAKPGKAYIDVKGLRQARGWTQQKAAAKLGIGRGHLSQLENNKCGFSAKMMEAIIQVYGVQYDDFYARGGKKALNKSNKTRGEKECGTRFR